MDYARAGRPKKVAVALYDVSKQYGSPLFICTTFARADKQRTAYGSTPEVAVGSWQGYTDQLAGTIYGGVRVSKKQIVTLVTLLG